MRLRVLIDPRAPEAAAQSLAQRATGEPAQRALLRFVGELGRVLVEAGTLPHWPEVLRESIEGAALGVHGAPKPGRVAADVAAEGADLAHALVRRCRSGGPVPVRELAAALRYAAHAGPFLDGFAGVLLQTLAQPAPGDERAHA